MANMFEGLLSLSRLGRQDLSLSEIDLGELASSVLQRAARDRPRPQRGIPHRSLARLWGDRAMMRQVLANLLANAIKFSAPRDPAVIELGQRTEGERLTYYIRDNGVGFDGRHTDRLFVPFQWLHAPEQFEGSGVGLAIVKRIIERHSGTVRVEGAPDAGATISFTLQERSQHIGNSRNDVTVGNGRLGEPSRQRR